MSTLDYHRLGRGELGNVAKDSFRVLSRRCSLPRRQRFKLQDGLYLINLVWGELGNLPALQALSFPRTIHVKPNGEFWTLRSVVQTDAGNRGCQALARCPKEGLSLTQIRGACGFACNT